MILFWIRIRIHQILTIRIQSIQIHITTLFYIFILVERRRTPRSFDLEEDAEQPALNSQVNHDFAAVVPDNHYYRSISRFWLQSILKLASNGFRFLRALLCRELGTVLNFQRMLNKSIIFKYFQWYESIASTWSCSCYGRLRKNNISSDYLARCQNVLR